MSYMRDSAGNRLDGVPLVNRIYPQQYGARGDTRFVTDLVTTAASAVVTSASAAFTSADVGKTMLVSRAAGGSGTTLAAGASSGAASISLTATMPAGPYLLGTGGTAEVVTISTVTGSGPYTANLGQSNTNQTLVNAHNSGEALVPVGLLSTTIASVQSATQATLAATATLGMTGLAAWFGTDDTAAFTALAAAATKGIRVELGPYKYMIPTTTITFPKRITVKGHGGLDKGLSATSLIVTASKTADALVFSDTGCTLEDFAMVNATIYSTPPTAGNGIRFTDGSYSHLHRVGVVSYFGNLCYDDGNYYSISKCHLYDPVAYGISCATAFGEHFDHGDQTIDGCTIAYNFTAYRQGGTAVKWRSGGGLRFTNNKVNGMEQPTSAGAGRMAYGLDVRVSDGGATSVLVVTGNSIESCTAASVYVGQAGPSNTGNFTKVVVVGNEIAIGGGVGVALVGGQPGGYIKIATVSGNVFTDITVGISLTNVTNVAIGVNTHDSVQYAVSAGSGVFDCLYEPQMVTTPTKYILSDQSSGSSTQNSVSGFASHRHVRGLPTMSIANTYYVMDTIQVPQYTAGVIEVTFTGNAVMVGNFLWQGKRAYQYSASGSVTLTTIGTDTIIGAAATDLDVLLDVSQTGTPGSIIPQLRKKAGGSATNLIGHCEIRVQGPIYLWRYN